MTNVKVKIIKPLGEKKWEIFHRLVLGKQFLNTTPTTLYIKEKN